VTALRVLSFLITSSAKTYDEFFSIGSDKVIVFCLHNNHAITSLESMEVLFDMVVPSKKLVFTTHVNDPIDRVRSLKLLCDVACSSAQRIQLGRSALDWLKGVCDEVRQ
jgi:hypothetical protein